MSKSCSLSCFGVLGTRGSKFGGKLNAFFAIQEKKRRATIKKIFSKKRKNDKADSNSINEKMPQIVLPKKKIARKKGT